MAIKKSELYSSLWESCDKLRGTGGMDASQYKDYVLTMLFVKYVSDKYAGNPMSLIEVPKGASFDDMVALKGQPDIGDRINKEILRPLFSSNGLEGSLEIVDFNDDEKLGGGKEKVELLSKLIAIFENPALNFKNNRAEDDDILGDAYEFLMRHFATESGKSKGQFYTPAEVSRILSKVIDVDKADKPSFTAYDPTCGSGSLLLKVAGEAPNGLTLYGQEKDVATKGLAVMNMWLHGHPEASITGKNTISSPQFTENGQLKRFDFVVANPPFSVKNWDSGIVPLDDEYNRFRGFGVPPEKNGDYAFLLHIIASLKSTGKGAIILPHGVLFRGNAEAEIRQNIIERKWIKGIIGLPANLFYGTGIPACIIVIDKENAEEREGIFMIDASKGFIKDGNKNRLRDQDLHKIVDVFNYQKPVDKFSRFVKFDEIEKNEFNLNIPRYIDTQEEEDIQDLNAHLSGGIPNKDIEGLNRFWEVYPSLKSDLFAHLRDGYSKLNVEASEIKNTIYNHPEFTGYSDKLNGVFASWKDKVYQNLQDINETTAPKKLADLISETLLNEYNDKPLVDKYNMYQHLMDYWNDVMKDDVYLLVEDGWVAKTKRILETNKKGKEVDKGWTCDLIPKELVINKFLKDDLKLVLDCESKIEALESEITTLTEEHGGEEDALNEVTKVKEAKENLEDFLGLAYDAYAKDINKDRISHLNNLSDELDKLNLITSNPELEALKNAKGTITKKAVTEKIKSITDTSNDPEGSGIFLGDDYLVLNDWINTTKEVASIKKEIKSVTQILDEIIEDKIKKNIELEYLKEIDVIYNYINLHGELTSAKKELKEANENLDVKTLEQYSKLTEADVRALVVDDKWIASLSDLMQSEIDAISQRLTGRIKELADRYENTLGELTTSTKTLEESVSAHLEKMGLVWS